MHILKEMQERLPSQAAQLVGVLRGHWVECTPVVHLYFIYFIFYFCWAVLKVTRPHNRRLSASRLGRESLIIIPGSRSELHPRGSQQIDSLPADWDSHSLVRKWKKLLPGGKKSAGKFQWVCVWKKSGGVFPRCPTQTPPADATPLRLHYLIDPPAPHHCVVMALICRAPPDGRRVPCCGALSEDEASGLPNSLSVTTQTAGSRTKNRGCAESHKIEATQHISAFNSVCSLIASPPILPGH